MADTDDVSNENFNASYPGSQQYFNARDDKDETGHYKIAVSSKIGITAPYLTGGRDPGNEPSGQDTHHALNDGEFGD